jgi:hypothetical protein
MTMAILQHLNNPHVLRCTDYNNFFGEDKYIVRGLFKPSLPAGLDQQEFI